MKKLLTITLTVLLAMLIIVSCSPDTQNVEENLAVISFNAHEGGARSLTKTNPVLDAEEFYWSYTAEKTDGTGATTGVKTTQETLKDGKGLAGVTKGPFSYGEWKFTLYGYTDSERNNLAYQGESEITINKALNTLTVKVDTKSTGADGYLQFPAKGSIALTGDFSTAIDYTKFVEKICIKPVDTVSTQNEITAYNKAADSGKTTRTFTLKSGSYSVTVCYLQGAETSDEGATYTGGYVVAEDTIYVTVADYLTTVIGGNVAQNTGELEEVKVELKEGVANVVKTATVTDGATEVVVTVAASPETKTSEVEGAEAQVSETKVSIPSDLITDTTITSAKLSVTSYSQQAAAEEAPTYTIEGASTTSVLGGLDIDLYIGDSETATTTFAEGKTLTVTTYIAKGLTQSDIVIKYNGTDGKSDGTVTDYDGTTGELTFTVSHLSSYFIVAKDKTVYNSTKGIPYATLLDAVSKASDGDAIILWQDATLSANLVCSKSLTFDLGGNTLDFGKSALQAMFCNPLEWKLCNGKIKGDSSAGNGCVFVMLGVSGKSVITLENISAEYKGCAIVNFASNSWDNSNTVNIINSNLSNTGEYCVYMAVGNVNISNSTLNAENTTTDALGMMVLMANVDISDSVIRGASCGVVIDGGESKISNSTIRNTNKDASSTYSVIQIGSSRGNTEVELNNVKLEKNSENVTCLSIHKADVAEGETDDKTLKVTGTLAGESKDYYTEDDSSFVEDPELFIAEELNGATVDLSVINSNDKTTKCRWVDETTRESILSSEDSEGCLHVIGNSTAD